MSPFCHVGSLCDILLKICCIIKKTKTNLILPIGEAEGIKQTTFVGFGKNWLGNKAFNLTTGKKVKHFINEARI